MLSSPECEETLNNMQTLYKLTEQAQARDRDHYLK